MQKSQLGVRKSQLPAGTGDFATGTGDFATWGFCNRDWGFPSWGFGCCESPSCTSRIPSPAGDFPQPTGTQLGIVPGVERTGECPWGKSPVELGIFPSQLGLSWGSSPAAGTETGTGETGTGTFATWDWDFRHLGISAPGTFHFLVGRWDCTPPPPMLGSA